LKPPAQPAADTPAAVARILTPEGLAAALAADGAIDACRGHLAATTAKHAQQFETGTNVRDLMKGQSNSVDETILAAWQQFLPHSTENYAVFAVGGYGRGELHPHSDIDLMILVPDDGDASMDEPISALITFLWDIGLEVGHSVRTLADCDQQAREDVQILTTLMEARLLAGSGDIALELSRILAPEQMWDDPAFFAAKVKEQQLRHARYHDTAYNLEPNVKGGPGGLRDIQTILWLAMRHLGAGSLAELVDHGFLTPGQLRLLDNSQEFLWRIRFALHKLTVRREDRLLFDHQVKLAAALGYEDATFTLAVEQLMQKYYRTVMEVSRLNEMLIQLFEESILLDQDAPTVALSRRFHSRNGYLEAVDQDVFVREPSALLEIFVLLEQNLDLKGVSAHTISLVKQHLWLIDEEFRQNPRNHRLFLTILKAPQGVTRTLKRMNTYGVLGLYIPAFGRVVGRMQYDLFHAYTVDAHTLFVVENLRRMSLSRFDRELPECSRIMQALEKPEIAYLAGLFHDIAKGRGGDHSELGAVDAEAFCLEHGMSRYESRLVAWLVANHLNLSITAQKRDLADPDVIIEFATKVGDRAHLDYLYLLTVADVRGTNPKLWNAWKDSLFTELYVATRRALRRGLENPIDKDELIAETQLRAERLLGSTDTPVAFWRDLWSRLADEYFLRYRAEEIAWHAQTLAQQAPSENLIVEVSAEIRAGSTGIMAYAPYRLHSFARITATLDEFGLNVLDARIIPTGDGRSLDTYWVLEADGSPLIDPRRISQIRLAIIKSLNATEAVTVTRRAPRQVRMFSTPLRIEFSSDDPNHRTVLELVAGDRPGMLSRIGKIFRDLDVDLENAKITTVGERAEDVFFISANNQPLDETARSALGQQLAAEIGDRASP
jgi:[protein-PII] uridylyltransferase